MSAAIVLSVVGTRRRSKTAREGGYVAFIVGAIAAVWMTWSMSAIWDSSERERALTALGCTDPVFSASPQLVGDRLPPITFTAVCDGERMRGVLEQVDGTTWRVREIAD
ncbi:hypothetical protein ACWKWP_07315 [Agromyces soli]